MNKNVLLAAINGLVALSIVGLGYCYGKMQYYQGRIDKGTDIAKELSRIENEIIEFAKKKDEEEA